MQKSLNVVYVTVGTTQFDALIEAITSPTVLNQLKSKGCERLILQTGNGTPVDAEVIQSRYGITVEQYRFKVNAARSDMRNADLVIGHAGAGTCMDILNAGKTAIVVINAKLMNNHQRELAEQLADDNYIYYCEVPDLSRTLNEINVKPLKAYDIATSTANLSRFVECLSNLMQPYEEKNK